jgi:hypothetical protein
LEPGHCIERSLRRRGVLRRVADDCRDDRHPGVDDLRNPLVRRLLWEDGEHSYLDRRLPGAGAVNIRQDHCPRGVPFGQNWPRRSHRKDGASVQTAGPQVDRACRSCCSPGHRGARGWVHSCAPDCHQQQDVEHPLDVRPQGHEPLEGRRLPEQASVPALERALVPRQQARRIQRGVAQAEQELPDERAQPPLPAVDGLQPRPRLWLRWRGVPQPGFPGSGGPHRSPIDDAPTHPETNRACRPDYLAGAGSEDEPRRAPPGAALHGKGWQGFQTEERQRLDCAWSRQPLSCYVRG